MLQASPRHERRAGPSEPTTRSCRRCCQACPLWGAGELEEQERLSCSKDGGVREAEEQGRSDLPPLRWISTTSLLPLLSLLSDRSQARQKRGGRSCCLSPSVSSSSSLWMGWLLLEHGEPLRAPDRAASALELACIGREAALLHRPPAPPRRRREKKPRCGGGRSSPSTTLCSRRLPPSPGSHRSKGLEVGGGAVVWPGAGGAAPILYIFRKIVLNELQTQLQPTKAH